MLTFLLIQLNHLSPKFMDKLQGCGGGSYKRLPSDQSVHMQDLLSGVHQLLQIDHKRSTSIVSSIRRTEEAELDHFFIIIR